MEYIQALLQAQTALAAAFEEETQLELQGQMVLPGFGRQQDATGQEAERDESRSGASGPEEEEARRIQARAQRRERPARALLRRLEALWAAGGRIKVSGETMMERALQQTQARQGAWVSEQGMSRFSGGLTSESARQMAVSGVAGQTTHRSMGEISRFFERDARRYGG